MTIRRSNLTLGGTPFTEWAQVVAVRPYANTMRVWRDGVELPQRTDLLELETHSAKTGQMVHCGVAPDTLHVKLMTAEEHATTLAAALAFQSTLTARGTPRKSRS
jgi:hypothetical protein